MKRRTFFATFGTAQRTVVQAQGTSANSRESESGTAIDRSLDRAEAVKTGGNLWEGTQKNATLSLRYAEKRLTLLSQAIETAVQKSSTEWLITSLSF